MSFRIFFRSLLCLPLGRLSSKRPTKQRRRKTNARAQGPRQLPTKRWCDPAGGDVANHQKPRPANSTADKSQASPQETTKTPQRAITRKPVLTPVRTTPVASTQHAIRSPRLTATLSPRTPTSLPYIPTAIEARQVEEVITIIGKSFPHIPCAVTGLAAMVHHGFTKRLPKEVVLSFPEQYHDVIRPWAVSQGFLRVDNKWDTFGVPLSGCQHRYLKVKFLARGFRSLRIVKAGDPEAPAHVINLPTIVVQTARAYIRELLQAESSQQHAFARDMCWALRSMERLGLILYPYYARYIVQHRFWEPFTLSFPHTVSLFAAVGLGPSQVVALQNELEYAAQDYVPDSDHPDTY